MSSKHFQFLAGVGKAEQLSVPPGFASLSEFTLKRRIEREEQDSVTSHCFGHGYETDSFLGRDMDEFRVFLNRRPWILYDRLTENPRELDTDHSSKIGLPKGVIRGCSSCRNCQKVVARWHPGDARITELEEVPVFHPGEEEFKDLIKYISSIYPQAKKYGICRIVPPLSWQLPCLLKEKNKWDNSTFRTQVQHVHELWSHPRSKRKRSPTPEKKDKKRSKGVKRVETPLKRHKFVPGCQFTLESFKTYADDFKNQYFSGMQKDDKGGLVSGKEHLEPTLANIEGEYNRIIENPSEEIEVLYGADIDTIVFGSGFPKPEHPEYIESDWNLNNVPKLPGSVLAFGTHENSSILTPKLSMGMCFSSVCWNVAEHHLCVLSYMHIGSPRIWYGSPGMHAFKFESALKKNPANLHLDKVVSFHKSAIQIPPSVLKSQGIPVYRCIQKPGEFVLVLPGSYHASFDCGFNCSEKAYFAPIDWILHGLNAAEVYQNQRRKTMISFDKILMTVALEAVRATWERTFMRKNSADIGRWMPFCQKDGILTKALKSRVEQETTMRNHLCNKSKTLMMTDYFKTSTTQKLNCAICYYNLHISAAVCSSCSSSPNTSKFACLRHAKQLCSCPWSSREFLFRHSIDELNVLVHALEGKVSAVYKWAKDVMGLRLSRLQADP